MNQSTNFLKSLAEKCHQQFGETCDQLTIIFPNKRAGVYFAKYLADLYEKPVWSPVIYSFEEFVQHRQDRTLADALQLNFTLYNTYKEIVKQPETFDAFLPWGEMILKDFNDIDNYLVDPEHIFRVVKSQKELDESFYFLSERDQKVIQQFWKGFLPEPNKKQHEFIRTWSILSELYLHFNKKLVEQNLAYKGRIFRDFAEDEMAHEGKTWFAGFNAFTKAEEKIVKHFLEEKDNDIFWDVDAYYFEDKNQESGTFFREYAENSVLKTSILRDMNHVLNDTEKKVEIVSAPFSQGQILAASQVLDNKVNEGTKPSDILVVLTDESMLDNLVKNLPPAIDPVNVTMGWPMAKSRVYLMISRLILLQERMSEDTFRTFYIKEIETLFEFSDLLGVEDQVRTKFKTESLKTNKLYYTIEEIQALFPRLEKLLVLKQPSVQIISGMVNFLKSLDLDLLPELERSVVVLLHKTIKQIQIAMANSQIELGMKSFIKLFQKLGQSTKLPLSGDPLNGLQVMGILETRNLSFKNVMILGMNEGAWPKDSANSSFIPFNIRKAFDLPVVEHQDAMQSYLFYRLIQSAENVWISYNNVTEFNHNGELSRYVQQLKYESNLNISENSVVNKVEAEIENPIIIKKEGEVLDRLRRYLISKSSQKKRLSPSALNSYLDCKLRFYFRYVQELYEPKELIEDMDPSLLGNLLHGGMEHLYTGVENLDEDTLRSLKKNIDQALNASFVDQNLSVEDGGLQIGRQLIAYEVIKKFMEAIVDFDIRNSPFKILGLEEEEFFVDFPIETEGRNQHVALKGIIDRIDQLGEVIRIIDYKSGRDERNFNDVETLVDRSSDKRNKAVFQLFYYSMLYKENHPDLTMPIRPGMYNSKDLFERNFDSLVYKMGRPKKAVLDYAEYEADFKVAMSSLLTDIFDPDIDFVQTEDHKKCEYCPYKHICVRG